MDMGTDEAVGGHHTLLAGIRLEGDGPAGIRGIRAGGSPRTSCERARHGKTPPPPRVLRIRPAMGLSLPTSAYPQPGWKKRLSWNAAALSTEKNPWMLNVGFILNRREERFV